VILRIMVMDQLGSEIAEGRVAPPARGQADQSYGEPIVIKANSSCEHMPAVALRDNCQGAIEKIGTNVESETVMPAVSKRRVQLTGCLCATGARQPQQSQASQHS
jgi:hypothetical protein